MRTASLVLRRSRARIALLSVTALVVLIAAAAITVIAGGLIARTEASAASALSVHDDSNRFGVAATEVDPDDRERVARVLDTALNRLAPFAIITDDSSVPRDDGTSTVARIVHPSASARSVAGAERLSARLDRVIAALQPDSIEGTQLTTSGGLPDTLADGRRGVLATWSVAPVPIALVLVFALIALAQIASLIVEARRSETALLGARGATRTNLAVLGLVEGLIVAVPAAAAGWGVGVATAGVHGAGVWPLAAIPVGLSAVALGTASWLSGRPGTDGRASSASAVLVIGSLIAAVAALASAWQLIGHGSAVVDGALVDVIAVAAPVLVLGAGALVAVLAFRPLAGWYATTAARSRGFSPVFGARQLARRTGVMPVAVLTIALASGMAVFAAGYSSTWTAESSARAERANGADVRVRLADPDAGGSGGEQGTDGSGTGGSGTNGAGADAATVTAATEHLHGVKAAAPVATAALRIGTDPADLVAIAGGRAAETLSTVGGTVDPRAIGRAITTVGPGLAIPAGTTSVTTDIVVTAPADQARGTIAASLQLADADGALIALPAGAVAVSSGGGSLTAKLPPGTWRLLAIDLDLGEADGASGIMAGVRSASARAGATAAPSALAVPDDAVELASADSFARIMSTPDSVPVPAVVSRALAEASALTVGDRVQIDFDGAVRSTTVTVAGVVAVVPGSSLDAAVIASLPALDDALLRGNDTAIATNEVWAASTDPAATAEAIRSAHSDAQVSIAEPGAATMLAAAAIPALWIGFAASAVLGAMSIIAVSITLTAARREETAVLRALGVPLREQARSRAGELALLIAVSLLLGGLVGVIAVLAAAAPLARGAVVAPPLPTPLSPTVDAVSLTLALVALVIGLGAVVVGYTAALRIQAATALVDGERR